MKKTLIELQHKLERELAEIEITKPNMLDRFKTGAQIADSTEEELKQLVEGETFPSKEDEIYFFRHIQPGILSRKIYYSQLFRIEADSPKILRGDYKKFLDRELQRIDMFFEEHHALNVYVSSGATNKDEQYFLRNSHYNNEYPVDLDGMLDTRFCTVASFKLAELIAYRDVSKYLMQKTDGLNGNGARANISYKPKLRWTDSKTDLVELVYALYSAGSFNNGVADIKQIFDWLENTLEVDFGHGYSHFRDIRVRKKGTAVFLNRLIECLHKRIEELDEEADSRNRFSE